MELTSRIYDKNSPNLDSMREQFERALSCLLENYIPNTSEQTVSPQELGKSMQQFFNILDNIDDAANENSMEDDMDDLAISVHLHKAHRTWGSIYRVLSAAGVLPKVVWWVV